MRFFDGMVALGCRECMCGKTCRPFDADLPFSAAHAACAKICVAATGVIDGIDRASRC